MSWARLEDRAGQTWETEGGELWLVTSSTPFNGARTKHNVLILDSPVASLVGRISWSFEVGGTWDHPRSLMRRLG